MGHERVSVNPRPWNILQHLFFRLTAEILRLLGRILCPVASDETRLTWLMFPLRL